MSIDAATKQQSLEATLRALEKGGDTERMDAFLDELLRLSGEREIVVCTAVGGESLRVESGDDIVCEVRVLRARPKLRTLCARLAVRCREWSGAKISPYGDEAEFDCPVTNRRCKVIFENKPGRARIQICS